MGIDARLRSGHQNIKLANKRLLNDFSSNKGTPRFYCSLASTIISLMCTLYIIMHVTWYRWVRRCFSWWRVIYGVSIYSVFLDDSYPRHSRSSSPCYPQAHTLTRGSHVACRMSHACSHTWMMIRREFSFSIFETANKNHLYVAPIWSRTASLYCRHKLGAGA